MKTDQTPLNGGNEMKETLSAGLALIVGLAGPGSGDAQPTKKSTPTTRILAIGTINPGVEQAKVLEILPNEVRETVNLYLDGKIDQWYSLQDRRGVVFILNVTDPTVAREMLEKLPLGQAHLMSFELIPLGPLNPLRRLPGMTAKPQ
jgi:hypothetical protein